MDYKDYQIFNGDVHITHISTRTKREASAYFFGLVEGYKNCGGKGVFTLVSERGILIHTRALE